MPKRMKRSKCTTCQAVRLHDSAVRKNPDGHYSNVWICSACCSTFPAGGYCCWDCGHDRFFTGSNGTVKRSRPGALMRWKTCCNCGSEFDEIAKLERRHALAALTIDKIVRPTVHPDAPRTWEEALARLSEKAFRAVRRCGVWEQWAARTADRLNRRAGRGATEADQGCEAAVAS